MSSRRPFHPIPATRANVSSTRYAGITTTNEAANGTHDMADHVLDDAQDAGSIVSGLTSLSGDDEFERLLIQNARDERRRNEALNGRARPFSKARAHARVGLTLDNLERNDAQNNNAFAANARIAVKSPPSSGGSTRSDPPVYAPAAWGRKGRTNLDWLRNIRSDEQPQQTPAPPEENVVGQHDNGPLSPLSHKSFNQGYQGYQGYHSYQDYQGNQRNQRTPRHDNSGDWDLTFEMNEASMLVSTPYVPRNTKLDDIREREIESLREQGVATARPDRILETSPEEKRRPRSSAGKADAEPQSQEQEQEQQQGQQQQQEQGSPTKRLRQRTNSWQSLGKSQPELGKENSPITVYTKGVQTVGVVERHVVASAEKQTPKPFSSRPTDSQDLLRRLARVSNTPSPKETRPARPQTNPSPQPHNSIQTAVTETSTSHTKPERKEESVKTMPAEDTVQVSTSTPPEQATREQRQDTPHDGTTPDVPSSAPATEDVDATPLPVERSMLQPKTPYVMGGWLDTPGPRTTHKTAQPRREPSQSPKRSTSKSRSPQRPTAPAEAEQPLEETSQLTQPSPPRPQLPGSALHALVQEARANHDYGDDTLHSLEDLMTPQAENETEEDTLQSLQLPTIAPRNEAERLRQAEREDLNRHRRHLQATITSMRDVSRGLRRVSTLTEHTEVVGTSENASVPVRNFGHEFSPWLWFRSFFWDERLKTQREVKNAPLKMWGGFTLLGILLTLSFIWWASETVAWYVLSLPIFILLSLG
jgi:hypothetical protein